MASTALTDELVGTEGPQQVTAALIKGQKILIVGGPSGTFPDKWNRHRDLIIWPSTEAKRDDHARTVPENVGAIFVTNMVSHELHRAIQDQAKNRHIWAPSGVLSSGTIRRMVEPILWPGSPRIALAPTPEPPAAQPAPVAHDPVAHARDFAQTVLGVPDVQESPAPTPTDDPVKGWFDDSVAAMKLAREAYEDKDRQLAAKVAEIERLQRELDEANKNLQGLMHLKNLLKNL